LIIDDIKMRRLIVLLLVIIIVFTACSSEANSNESSIDYFEGLHQEIDLEPNLENNVSLYFLSKDSEKLVVETRTIAFNQQSKSEYDVINTLLAGPEDSHLAGFDDSYSLESIEILNNLANIYIRCSDDSITERDNFILAMALTNTISDYSGVNYVNVLINEQALSINGDPVGVMVKNKNDINEELAKQQQNAANKEFLTALYYLDTSSEYIVPEVRNIKYGSSDYASEIIFELAKGPQEAYMYNGSVESSLRTASNSYLIENDITGGNILSVDLNKSPLIYNDESNLSVAAICNSLCSFIPDLNGIRLSINGHELNYVVYRRTQFKNLIGADMQLYFADQNGMLRSVSKTVPQSETNMPIYVIYELMSGAGGSDSNAIDVFPDDVNESDVKNAYFAGDTIVVNWRRSMLDKVSGLTENQERLMVYSIVNSLTSLKNVRRVQFLVEGERVESFGGRINIIDPLLSNPGLVR